MSIKSELQRKENDFVLKNLDVFYDVKADAYWNYHLNRLDSCQAWYYDTGDYVVLKSYNTVVAFYNRHTNEFFDVLRYVYGYTATSAKHISKFRNRYRPVYPKYYTYYPC